MDTDLPSVQEYFAALSPKAQLLFQGNPSEEVSTLLDHMADVETEGQALTNKRSLAEEANASIYNALDAVRECERKKRKTGRDIETLKSKLNEMQASLDLQRTVEVANERALEAHKARVGDNALIALVKEGREYRSTFSNTVGAFTRQVYDCYAESSPSFQSEHPGFNPSNRSNRSTATARACEIVRLLAAEAPDLIGPFTFEAFEHSFCGNTQPGRPKLKDTVMSVDDIFRTEKEGTFVIVFYDDTDTSAEVELAIWKPTKRVFTAMTSGSTPTDLPAIWKVPGDVAAAVANGGSLLTSLHEQLAIADSLRSTNVYKVETPSGSSAS